MLSRYVVSLVAFHEGELKLKTIVTDKNVETEEIELMMAVLFPGAEKTLGSVALVSIGIPESKN
jgi:hypothetical protein